MMIKFLLLLIFSTSTLWAYPQFIGHGYTSCMNCHFNPFGAGPLNDYGRAVSATAISSRAFYPKSVSEEKLAYLSGFMFRPPKQNWLRTQANYRGFELVRNPNSSSGEKKSFIIMQEDLRVVLKGGENDKFLAVFNYGYSPIPANVPQGTEEKKYRSREHYLGYRINPKWGVYTGLMDKVYGIRVVEHNSFSRTTPQLTQNDQTHGVAVHYLDDKWEGGVHGFVGNLEQDKDIRMQGASTMIERTVADLHRVGASFLTSKNDYLSIMSYSVHGKFNLKEGSALLAEIGQTHKDPKENTDPTTARYGLLQTSLRPIRGLYLLSNIEYYNANIENDTYSVRFGPAIQYFPIQRLEFRFDIYNTRVFSPDNSPKDIWFTTLQTHVWL